MAEPKQYKFIVQVQYSVVILADSEEAAWDAIDERNRKTWREQGEFIKVSDVDLLEVRSSEEGETDD